jgi:hypothetical protein
VGDDLVHGCSPLLSFKRSNRRRRAPATPVSCGKL